MAFSNRKLIGDGNGVTIGSFRIQGSDLTLTPGVINESTGGNGVTINNATFRDGNYVQQEQASMSSSIVQSIPENFTTQFTFDTVDSDSGGLVDLPNNRLVIQRSGLYFICGSATRPSGVETEMSIFVSGAPTIIAYGYDTFGPPASTFTIQAKDVLSLSAGDFLTLHVFFRTPGGGNENFGNVTEERRIKLSATFLSDN